MRTRIPQESCGSGCCVSWLILNEDIVGITVALLHCCTVALLHVALLHYCVSVDRADVATAVTFIAYKLSLLYKLLKHWQYSLLMFFSCRSFAVVVVDLLLLLLICAVVVVCYYDEACVIIAQIVSPVCIRIASLFSHMNFRAQRSKSIPEQFEGDYIIYSFIYSFYPAN